LGAQCRSLSFSLCSFLRTKSKCFLSLNFTGDIFCPLLTTTGSWSRRSRFHESCENEMF
jgi:hypothetical protein